MTAEHAINSLLDSSINAGVGFATNPGPSLFPSEPKTFRVQATIRISGAWKFGPFQYAAGVAAMPCHAIERVRFASPVRVTDGFRRIEAVLSDAGLLLTAFCTCEPRSPAPLSDAGFIAFNHKYEATGDRCE